MTVDEFTALEEYFKFLMNMDNSVEDAVHQKYLRDEVLDAIERSK